MGFNYGLEKKKFDREWDKLREEYRAAGMDEASIEAMYEFDLQAFNEECAGQNLTPGMPECAFPDVDGADECYTISAYNTCTGKYEDISVTKAIYDEYRRGGWRMDKNEGKHRANETPFSALRGSENGGFENFREFISDESDPERLMTEKEQKAFLHNAVAALPDKERVVIELFFFGHLSCAEIGARLRITEQAVSGRRRSAFRRLKKILEKF